jgi:hypothetical protein
MIKGKRNKLEPIENKKRRNNFLSTLLFFVASYLMLQSPPNESSDLLLGVAFLIAGIYGVVALYKKEKFVF